MAESKEKFFELRNLTVKYHSGSSIIHAVNDVSLDLNAGETLGLVGETGAGKTTIAKSILRILPENSVESIDGEILFEGRSILDMDSKEMQAIRGKSISMIFQDPMTALNPVKTVLSQIAEGYKLHHNCSKAEANKRAIEMLEMVGIGEDRAEEYPHQFSGGMKQRVIIAIALACSPKLLIADEPTTALDVTIQAQILHLMRELKEKKNTSVIMITHDLGIVAETCDRVAVMYAGKIIEEGTLDEVFNHTLHPYTEGLFNSLPNIKNRTARLRPIHGLMPDPTDLPEGCAFAPRCNYATEACKKRRPDLVTFTGTHKAACLAYEDKDFHIERGKKNG